MRWVLFAVMAATVPAFYFLFVVAGFLPLAYVAWMTREDPSLWLPNLIHILLWAAIFYGVAWLVAKLLSRLPRAAGWAGVVAIAGSLAWVALQPIYGVGHSQYAGVPVHRLFVKPAQQSPMVVTPSAPRPMLAPAAGQHRSAPSPR